jgi:hypothetical protein
VIISRRSVDWSYRVLRSTDGAELGADSGTADEQRPCDELATEADGDTLASWSPLPQDRIGAVAAAFAGAPHPREACSAVPPPPAEATETPPTTETPPETPAIGLALHATWSNDSRVDLELPKGWMATDDRPVEAVLCAQINSRDASPDAAETTPAQDPAAPNRPETRCATTVSLTAMARNGEWLGQWDYTTDECPGGTNVVLPLDWWTETVGPDLGYTLAPPASSTTSTSIDGSDGE